MKLLKATAGAGYGDPPAGVKRQPAMLIWHFAIYNKLNLMFRRKGLVANLESPLTPFGVAILLGLFLYLFSGIFLLGVGKYLVAALMLMPVVAFSAFTAYRECSLHNPRSNYIGKVIGIANVVLVVGYLIYLGAKIYVLSKV